MVAILASFWHGPFSGAMFVSGKVFLKSRIIRPPSHTPGASKHVLLTPYEDMPPRGFLGQGTNAEPQLLQPLPGSCDFSDTRCRGARGSTSISPSADMAAPLGPLATGPDALNSAEGMSKTCIDFKSLAWSFHDLKEFPRHQNAISQQQHLSLKTRGQINQIILTL